MLVMKEGVTDKKCPFCGGSAPPLSAVGRGDFYRYACECGWYSKMFNTKDEARIWFNTRAGRMPEKHVEEVRIQQNPNMPKQVDHTPKPRPF